MRKSIYIHVKWVSSGRGSLNVFNRTYIKMKELEPLLLYGLMKYLVDVFHFNRTYDMFVIELF